MLYFLSGMSSLLSRDLFSLSAYQQYKVTVHSAPSHAGPKARGLCTPLAAGNAAICGLEEVESLVGIQACQNQQP